MLDAVDALDLSSLDERGFAVGPLLSEDDGQALVACWDEDRFRKKVIMARHNFGRGEYRYFADPLPELVAELRSALYEKLVPVARAWADAMGMERTFPPALQDFWASSEAAGQVLPTPLLLRYGPGDYNCLHQDLYGELWFPLQVVVLLSEPGADFEGGELVLVEQRPRAQSRPMVIPLRRGEAAVIPCHQRPRQGARGVHRVTVRHGVSEIRRGQRYALGIIFHGAVT